MKRSLKLLRTFIKIPIVIILIAAPYLALIFGAVSIVMGILAWGFGYAFAYSYLEIALYVYLGLAVVTSMFFVTYYHQHCCAGLQSFQSHLAHEGWKGIGSSVLDGFAWPWTWFTLHQFQKSWGLSFCDAVLHAFSFWFVSGGRGIEMTSVDLRTGDVTTTQLKTPEEAHAALKDFVAKDLKEDT